MSNEIVVIGSSNIDLIMKMSRLPKKGETITDAEFMQTFGGKGANQAVAAAKAGGDTYFVNCVGDDGFGPTVINNLKEAGVHVDYVFQERGVATGTALIMIGAAGENYLSVAPGANYRLDPTHIDRARNLIDQAALVVLQYEITPQTLSYAIDTAYSTGRKIMLNLAPARPIAETCLQKITYLVVNETEAEFLCGFRADSIENINRASEALLAMGPQTVIITLGAHGSFIANRTQRLNVPAFLVDAVDTTAAGDVFCGSLAVALVEGQSLEGGIRFASAAAAICVTRLGAQPSTPSRDEIEHFINFGKLTGVS